MGDDAPEKANGDVWTDPPSGQDAPGGLWTTVQGAAAGKGPGSVDFLGFTLYWKRSRGGRWILAFKTRCARLTRAIRSVYDRCRRHRHRSVKEQHAALVRHVRGHMNYFGVNGNIRSLHLLLVQVQRAWFKWLRRRSQRTRLTCAWHDAQAAVPDESREHDGPP